MEHQIAVFRIAEQRLGEYEAERGDQVGSAVGVFVVEAVVAVMGYLPLGVEAKDKLLVRQNQILGGLSTCRVKRALVRIHYPASAGFSFLCYASAC